MKKPKNAFLLQGYHSAAYFCDREEELSALKNHQLNERNVVLFSWRRLGKSALIKRFITEEERKGEIEAVYVDLLATSKTKEAIELIIQAVYEKFGKTKSGISAAFQHLMGSLGLGMQFDSFTGLPSFSVSLNQQQNAKDSLSSIGKFLSDRKKQVVIAIDEFQQIGNYEENAEATFRSFMQQFPMIRFIFSGSHRQMMTSMFSESKRPFYKSCSLISLEPISLEKYSPFIQHHFNSINKKIPTKLIASIYAWARGQTYAIQLICNRLYGSNLSLTKASFEKIKNEIMHEEAPIFANYFNLLTKVQWKVIQAIAKEQKVKSPQAQLFIQKYNLGAASSVRVALTMLLDKELVVQENGEYFVHDLIFSRWLESK